MTTPLTHLGYKPGWQFFLEIIREEPHLTISTTTADSYHPTVVDYHTSHSLPVPNDGRDLDRWVFDCIMLAEKHEAMEFYTVSGIRVYAPVHSRRLGTYYMLPEERAMLPPHGS